MRFLKLTLLILSAAVVLAAVACLPQELCFEGGDDYTFYCGTSSADCKVVKAENYAAAKRLSLKNVCGESASYENFDLQAFLKKVNGKIVFEEKFSDGVNYYCTADLPYRVNLYGKEINLHIAFKGESAKVASPIIFGGY